MTNIINRVHSPLINFVDIQLLSICTTYLPYAQYTKSYPIITYFLYENIYSFLHLVQHLSRIQEKRFFKVEISMNICMSEDWQFHIMMSNSPSSIAVILFLISCNTFFPSDVNLGQASLRCHERLNAVII